MRLLEIVEGYPDLEGGRASAFIHTRNLYYVKRGITPIVLDFRAKTDYQIDGIQVIRLSTYQRDYAGAGQFDLLLSHASNIRHHYRFLKRYETCFSHTVFFFHGHEILHIKDTYPEPYPYMRKTAVWKRIVQDLYDPIKLKLWKNYFTKQIVRSTLVFVSEYMRQQFSRNLLWNSKIENHSMVIENGIGKAFQQDAWDKTAEKKYDFITVRSGLDGSKYCADRVVELAQSHPQYRFLMIGRGEFFNHYAKPDNMQWENKILSHAELLQHLNASWCALMPTRWDSQGVMTCEMETFGMPVITSDIDIGKSITKGFANARCIPNTGAVDLGKLLEELKACVPLEKNTRYFDENTMGREVELFARLTGAKAR